MDEETLKPLAVSMFFTIMFIYLISKFIQPTTEIKQLDQFLAWVQAQRGSMANMAIFVSIIVLFTDYSLDSYE